jgi:glyoxylase-like metal-dependent hydrolase (beta-lactamase superfamily II)
MHESVAQAGFGPVTVYFGEKSGKYPDGNLVVVRGRDAMAVFDTPQLANRLGPVLAGADLAILGHVHEDHMAGLHLMPGKPVQVHEADLDAAQSWAGLSRHYGYPQPVLDALRKKIERDFHYRPRPDATGYADGAVWELGGVRVRAVHLPGHTAGHCVLLVEPQGIAFIGDIDLSSFGPYYGDASSCLHDFRCTLARLPELPASVWITSHHKGVIRRSRTVPGTAACLPRPHRRARGTAAEDAGRRSADAGRPGATASAVSAACRRPLDRLRRSTLDQPAPGRTDRSRSRAQRRRCTLRPGRPLTARARRRYRCRTYWPGASSRRR